MENGTEIPGLERTACVTYEQRVPEGALPGAELKVKDLLDISELCKLITQRPDGEAIAHKVSPHLDLIFPRVLTWGRHRHEGWFL